MTTDAKSSTSEAPSTPSDNRHHSENRNGWLKVGAVAAASAVLGGMAAAWFYRRTLSQLQEAQHADAEVQFGTTEDASAEDF